MSAQILIVEDEPDLAAILDFHLKREGYRVSICIDGAAADEALAAGSFDLALLDWQLPLTSGIDLCKKWSTKVPIMMLTARDHPADIVLGLECGAYDYLTKPFEVPILLARVRAILRRAAPVATSEKTVEAAKGLQLLPDQYSALLDGVELSLTPNEFKLLQVLLDHQGKVLTRQALMNKVQGPTGVVTPRTVDTAVYELRKKLGASSGFIETVRGVGYRIQFGS